MSTLATTIFAAALVNNLVFVQLVGVSSFFLQSQRFKHSIEFALIAGCILFLSSCLNLLIYRWILSPLDLDLISLFLFVAVSVAVGLGCIKFVQLNLPLTAYRQSLALALLSTSSAVVGAALINTTSLLSTPQLIAYCFGTAFGFGFTIVAFAALRQRINNLDTPELFRGAPLELISAGIIAMAFLGFAGLV